MNETERGLRALLARAEVVPPYRMRAERESGANSFPARSIAAEGIPHDEADVTDLDVVRTFRYPGGRFWTVCVVTHPEDDGPPVLRFTSGMRSIDLHAWRKDWPDQRDEVLVEMLRRAAPRRDSGPIDAATPRRRWDDQPGPATESVEHA
jgi:hypothetical protein